MNCSSLHHWKSYAKNKIVKRTIERKMNEINPTKNIGPFKESEFIYSQNVYIIMLDTSKGIRAPENITKFSVCLYAMIMCFGFIIIFFFFCWFICFSVLYLAHTCINAPWTWLYTSSRSLSFNTTTKFVCIRSEFIFIKWSSSIFGVLFIKYNIELSTFSFNTFSCNKCVFRRTEQIEVIIATTNVSRFGRKYSIFPFREGFVEFGFFLVYCKCKFRNISCCSTSTDFFHKIYEKNYILFAKKYSSTNICNSCN